MPGYPHNASYFEYRLCHNFFRSKDRACIIEISCTDNNYFLCDRVCTQSKKHKEDVLVAFEWENVGWKMVYNFLGIDEKIKRNLFTFDQNVCTVYSNINTVYPSKNHVTTHPSIVYVIICVGWDRKTHHLRILSSLGKPCDVKR